MDWVRNRRGNGNGERDGARESFSKKTQHRLKMNSETGRLEEKKRGRQERQEIDQF